MAQSFDNNLQIYNLYPGGNDTYVCFDEEINRSEYAGYNKIILEKFMHFEQGGFLEKANSSQAVLRLQMAGGEFCGNALRSVAAVVFEDFFNLRRLASIAKYDCAEAISGGLKFFIDVSGVNQPLQTTVRPMKNNYYVTASLPIVTSQNEIEDRSVSLNGTVVPLKLARLKGITHAIVDGTLMPFVNERSEYEKNLKDVVSQLGLEDEAAVGLITFNKETGKAIKSDPVVWVRAIDTCFYESGCCSGAVAIAAVLALSESGSNLLMSIMQPSGIPLEVTINFDHKTGIFGTIEVGGEVEIRESLRLVHKLPDYL